MLMHQINAENAANSSGPSAMLPRGPQGVRSLVNSCLHIWDTRARVRAFVDDVSRLRRVFLVRCPVLVGARMEQLTSTHPV